MVVSEESGQLQMNLQIFCCLFLLLRLFSFPKTRALHRKGASFGTPTSAVPPNNSLRSNFQQNNKNPLLSPIPSASIKPYRYALQSQFAAIAQTQNSLAASLSELSHSPCLFSISLLVFSVMQLQTKSANAVSSVVANS
ncbi:hypothetical protein AHAS_Ahas16G0070700 [Arachis hypogaea]